MITNVKIVVIHKWVTGKVVPTAVVSVMKRRKVMNKGQLEKLLLISDELEELKGWARGIQAKGVCETHELSKVSLLKALNQIPEIGRIIEEKYEEKLKEFEAIKVSMGGE